MENQIYYCFERETGRFAGSGTPLIQNETHDCTLIAPNFQGYRIDWDKVFFRENVWILEDQ
jgi:hypothetical protein